MAVITFMLIGLLVGPDVRADEQLNAATSAPSANEGPFVRIGEVDGKTVGLARSAFDREGKVFLTHSRSTARVWDAQTLKPMAEPLVQSMPWFPIMSADGRNVLTWAGNEAKVWDVATSRVRGVVRVEDGVLARAEISPDGSHVLTISESDDTAVCVWRVGDPKPVMRLIHPHGIVTSIQYDPTGAWIVTYDYRTKEWHVWSSETGKEVGPPVKTDLDIMAIYAERFSFLTKQFLVPMKFGSRIVDLDSARPPVTALLDGDWEVVESTISFSTDGTRICMVGRSHGDCQIFDAKTGKFLRGFGSDMFRCTLIGNGDRLAICKVRDARVSELWDVKAGKKLQTIPEPFVEASPDGKTFLFAMPGERTSVWRLRE